MGTWHKKICNLCKGYGIVELEDSAPPKDIMMKFKENDNIKTILTLIEQNLSITNGEEMAKTGKSR